jgi:hypothetical protein
LLQRPYSKEEQKRDNLAWYLLNTFDPTARRVRILTRKKHAYLHYDANEGRYVHWDPASKFNHDFLEGIMRFVDLMDPDCNWLPLYREHLVRIMKTTRSNPALVHLSVELLRPTVMEKGLALKATVLTLKKKRKIYDAFTKRYTLNQQ